MSKTQVKLVYEQVLNEGKQIKPKKGKRRLKKVSIILFITKK